PDRLVIGGAEQDVRRLLELEDERVLDRVAGQAHLIVRERLGHGATDFLTQQLERRHRRLALRERIGEEYPGPRVVLARLSAGGIREPSLGADLVPEPGLPPAAE